MFSLFKFSGIATCLRTLIYFRSYSRLLKFSSIDDLKEFKDGEVTILFGKELPVWTTLFKKKLSLINAHEKKIFLTLELEDSLRILRLLPRTLYAGPNIYTFIHRSGGLIRLILPLLLITLYISIRSNLSNPLDSLDFVYFIF